nr:putative disease resistance protein RGA3 isoform X1 [Setaria viridis]
MPCIEAIICMLDTFRCQSHEEDTKGHVIINSSALSRLSSLKSLCFYNRDTPISKQLQEGIDELTSMILDAKELVVFLTSYPHLYRQPYCMHLVLGNCLFGRQMESEIVINFLLQTQPYGAEELEVLPIFGPIFVGKSTLVAHACKDERVRDHFSEILFFQNYGFTDDELATLRDGCARIHLNHVSISNKDRRLLVVIELVGDLNEDEWNRLYSASKRFVPCGGKIIVTSRSEKIKKFGTTRAVTLKYLPREAYWYFFKTLAFGSMDPKVQPRLTHLTMEIASTLDGSFIARNFTARLLRDNFDILFGPRF